MRLWVFAVRRIVSIIPVVIGILTVLFVLVSCLPTAARACAFGAPIGKLDPCSTVESCPGNPGLLCPNPAYQAAQEALGLSQPVPVQWEIFVWNGLTFHWGYVAQGSALGTGETGSGIPALAGLSVTNVLVTFLPYSMELLLLTFLFAVLIVVPVHRRALAHPGGPAEGFARGVMAVGLGVPLLIVGMLAQAGAVIAFGGPDQPSALCGGTSSVFLDFYGSWPNPPCTPIYGTTNIGPIGFPAWLIDGYRSTPTGFPTLDAALHGNGWLALDTVFRMAVPALVLALFASAVMFRYLRYTPMQRENRRYLRVARGQGLPESFVVDKIAGRSTVSVLFSSILPALVMTIGMLPVLEIIFNLWGAGRLWAYSIVGGVKDWDIGVLAGSFLAFALLLLIVNVALDIARAGWDPRFRVEGSNASRSVPPSSAEMSRSANALIAV